MPTRKLCIRRAAFDTVHKYPLTQGHYTEMNYGMSLRGYPQSLYRMS